MKKILVAMSMMLACLIAKAQYPQYVPNMTQWSPQQVMGWALQNSYYQTQQQMQYVNQPVAPQTNAPQYTPTTTSSTISLEQLNNNLMQQYDNERRQMFSRYQEDYQRVVEKEKEYTPVYEALGYIPLSVDGGQGSVQQQQSSSTNYSAPSQSHSYHMTCSQCGGSKEIVKEDGTSFGLGQKKWCEKCKREVFAGHVHVPCPNCKGKGYVE